ncbi:MAG: glycosyltransferase family 39 protein, partial [Pirellulaceae bacterium]
WLASGAFVAAADLLWDHGRDAFSQQPGIKAQRNILRSTQCDESSSFGVSHSAAGEICVIGVLEWLVGAKWRLPCVFAVYFALHALVRVWVSPALSFDESEQVFLSQWHWMGYNSQPPLYTWVQTALFGMFGINVFSLALLKNTLLFATYMAVFTAVKLTTKDLRLAALATLGLLLIPQIAWESHRDLSHTVAVTFATTLLLLSIVRLPELASKQSWLAYVIIGVACGVGAMSKYNFVIVVVAFVAASVSIPTYRRKLLDRKIAISVVVAAIIMVPHGLWVIDHFSAASSKTIHTLTTNETQYWYQNVLRGMVALAGSTISCCALLLTMVFLLFTRSLRSANPAVEPTKRPEFESALLVERFLICVGAMLVLIVLSGHALEFKNRWLQPYVALVPVYLVLKYGRMILGDRRSMNRFGLSACALMAVILLAVAARPISYRMLGRQCRMNEPYPTISSDMVQQLGEHPKVILVSDMQVAGNIKMQFPESLVLSADYPMGTEACAEEISVNAFWLAANVESEKTHRGLEAIAAKLLNSTVAVEKWLAADLGQPPNSAAALQPFRFISLTQSATRVAKAEQSQKRK